MKYMGKISFKVLKEKVTFMRKKLIGTIIIVIVGILIYAWSTTRNVQILQEMKASDFDKIEIWNRDESVVLTKQEDIQKFVDILQSTRIHKRKSPDRAGGWIVVDLYYKNGKQDDMGIAVDQINMGAGEYKTEKNIYDDINELYEELK